MNSVASLIRARSHDDQPGYTFEDRTTPWSRVVDESATRAAILRGLDPERPPHVGVLLDNSPEYLYWIAGAALVGACIVGINPTRRGAELERDIRHTDCQLIVTDSAGRALLDGLDLGITPEGIIDVDQPRYERLLDFYAGSPLPEEDPPADNPLFLLFTSGSTSAPKAVVVTNERMAVTAVRAGQIYGVSRDDTCYCPMPLFHGNALMACWGPALAVGAEIVLRRKFSASSFLADIREYNCTYFTYVGRTIAYVLAQPPSDLDKDHRLRMGFGTEASAFDRERFFERFGCPLVEGYGSSESVVAIVRTEDSPPNALGRERADLEGRIRIVDPATKMECPRVVFDEHGAITNPECIGEIVNVAGAGAFEGYYNNPEASAERIRDGWYWTGDLGFRDTAGFFYFAGRSADWLRVDSENFAAAPVESILARYPGVVMAAVYPVPDPRTGDMVMAALELSPGSIFDPSAFDRFLEQQRDLGTKWSPRLVRIVSAMPLTANNKVHKPPLRNEAWSTVDDVYWRPTRELSLQPMSDADRAELEREFDRNDRRHLLTSR